MSWIGFLPFFFPVLTLALRHERPCRADAMRGAESELGIKGWMGFQVKESVGYWLSVGYGLWAMGFDPPRYLLSSRSSTIKSERMQACDPTSYLNTYSSVRYLLIFT